MKRFVLVVCMVCVLAPVLFGCNVRLGQIVPDPAPEITLTASAGNGGPPEEAQADAEEEERTNTEATRRVGDEFAEQYIVSLDIALGDENMLLFDDASEISDGELYSFFLYAVNAETVFDGFDPERAWYRAQDGLYHIPPDDIQAVLDRYFDGAAFSPDRIADYDAKRGEVLLPALPHPAGVRYMKILSRTERQGLVRVIAAFYDADDYTHELYRKRYTFRFEKEGAPRYIAIEKLEQPREQDAPAENQKEENAS